MAALTIDLSKVEADFSRVAAEVSRTGKPLTVLKNNEPWAIIQPAKAEASVVDVAVDFMDEYADVFEELAK